MKESVWVCDCACVNRRAISDPPVLFVIPSEERERGEKRPDQSTAIEDQCGQTYTRHLWTRVSHETPGMFVNDTDDQLNVVVFLRQLATVLISYKSSYWSLIQCVRGCSEGTLLRTLLNVISLFYSGLLNWRLVRVLQNPWLGRYFTRHPPDLKKSLSLNAFISNESIIVNQSVFKQLD